MTETIPPGRWAEVEQRDRVCQASAWAFGSLRPCDGPMVVHHRQAKHMGGTSDPHVHDLENLVLLCNRHHVEVHEQVARARSCGLVVPSWQTVGRPPSDP